MVVDAYDTVVFGGTFVDALATGGVGWLEVCSRITTSLNDAANQGTLPYADDVEAMADLIVELRDSFDIVLIDCAPSLGLNTTNGLAAAGAALLVVEPSVFGLRGVSPALDLLEEVWSIDNSELDLAGVVLNRVPGVSSSAKERIAELKRMVGARSVWNPHIPQRVLINQAHHERAPIHSFGAQARDLTAAFDSLFRRLRRTVR